MKVFYYLYYCFLIIPFVGCQNQQEVDLIVLNAHIYTVDSAFSVADAMAITDGKIVAVGDNKAISTQFKSKEIVDAKGKTIIPGIIDAHAHFVGYGQSLFQVQLYGATSWDEVVVKVQQFAQQHPNEKWILGRGWDQNLWKNKSFPSNALLNQLFPNTPILLQRVDGHAAVANQKALDLAGIKVGQTLNGGTIEVVNNQLTGVLIDNAVDLVSSKIPQATITDMEKWLTAAQKNCFEQGLTTITDCGLQYTDVEKIDTLQQNDKLQIRMYVMLSDNEANYQHYLQKPPYKTDKLYVKGVKVYADGALGSRGACLLQHYSDKPGWKGFLLSSFNHFDSVAQKLINTPYQMCTHAIGDSANRIVLQIYAKYLRGKNDKRWRIEHAQTVNSADFQLFSVNNIIPSVQPTHATSDMYWAETRLGTERIKTAYAYQLLLQQNGWLPLGTDFPVEDISPFKTFLAAVFRVDAKGFPANGFQKDNALTPQQALKGMTIWAAKANCMENEVGSIEKGKKADFVILNQDLLQTQANTVLQTKVISTYLGGKKVYVSH